MRTSSTKISSVSMKIPRQRRELFLAGRRQGVENRFISETAEILVAVEAIPVIPPEWLLKLIQLTYNYIEARERSSAKPWGVLLEMHWDFTGRVSSTEWLHTNGDVSTCTRADDPRMPFIFRSRSCISLLNNGALAIET